MDLCCSEADEFLPAIYQPIEHRTILGCLKNYWKERKKINKVAIKIEFELFLLLQARKCLQ